MLQQSPADPSRFQLIGTALAKSAGMHFARSALRITAIVPLIVASSCNFPRDSEATLHRVRSGIIRVGYSIDAPWVTESVPAPGGIEPRLIADLAASLGAKVVWVKRPQADLIEALHARELDMVIGGLTMDSPYSAEAALTRPYYEDTVVVAAPSGVAAPVSLDGARVAVSPGDPVGAVIRKKGGSTIVTERSSQLPKPMHVWELPGSGYTSTGIVLSKTKHVIAASPGENAWLVHIERLLHARESSIPGLLRSLPK